MSFLLDTNVLSEWRKRIPDRGVAEWMSGVATEELFVSVVTIGEIRRGIARLQRRDDRRQALAYESWLARTKELFGDRVVPVDGVVAEQWGHDDAHGPVSMADGLIAATAKVHHWTVVTRNLEHFEPTGARVLNPFTG